MSNLISSLVLDIETTDLAADKGRILCGCYESSENPGVVETIRADDEHASQWRRGKRGDDRRVVAKLSEVIRQHDIVIAHNGRFFDIPFVRTRALVGRQSMLPDVVLVDPVQIARRKFRFGRNTLARILDTLELSERKTPLELSTWADVMLNGTRESMDEIVEHCIADVKALSALTKLIRPFIKQFDNQGSAFR